MGAIVKNPEDPLSHGSLVVGRNRLIETDEGIKGYGECSVSPHGIVGAIDAWSSILGFDMLRAMRQSQGGITAKAMAGIECALIDIKSKALGISAVELFGGPLRNQVRLYWSHCGTTRATHHEMVGGLLFEPWKILPNWEER